MSELNREPGKYPQLQLDNQLCFPLYAAARKVVNAYNPLLKPYGLTYTQYIVFLALWGIENGKAKVGDLGKQLYLDCGTLTPLLMADPLPLQAGRAGGIRFADRQWMGPAGRAEGNSGKGWKMRHL